jgi:hypothetical protein
MGLSGPSVLVAITKNYGNLILGTFQKATTSIIKTKTRLITRLITWYASLLESISQITQSNGTSETQEQQPQTSLISGILRQSGIRAMRAVNGTRSMLARLLMIVQRWCVSAKCAVSRLMIGRIGRGSVLITASQSSAERLKRTMKRANAVFAAPSFQRTDTCQLKLVAEPVVACFVPTGIKTVYNISVDGEPEYFANGVLVHNCVDSFRYLISTAPYWKDRGINRPTIKDDGLEISFSQDDTTMTDEQFNIRQQMNVSALYAAGKLPGWEPLAS